ncbi:MAG: hypothetical protein AB1782_06130 [Cyanobacteriota bacterium]
MKYFNQDCFIKSTQSNFNNKTTKLELFMNKIKLAKDISKLRTQIVINYPHYKNLINLARHQLNSSFE